MPDYKKVKKQRSGYSYRHPKTGKKVDVKSHSQHYNVRVYKPISRSKAQETFDLRSDRSKSIDKATLSKNTKEEPDEEWLENINRMDVEGIDTPLKQKHERINEINKKLSKLEQQKEQLEKEKEEKGYLASSDDPEWDYYKQKREINAKIGALEYEKNTLLPKEEQIKITKWTPDLVDSLAKAVGNEPPIPLKELSEADKLARIGGYDSKYGLERKFLGGYDANEEDFVYELERIPIGSLVERRNGGVNMYRKIGDDEFVKVGEKAANYGKNKYVIYGIPISQDLEKLDSKSLKIMAMQSPDEATRISAIQKLEDIQTLKEIGMTDASHEVSSKAYHKIKSLDRDNPALGELRNYYEFASKLKEINKEINRLEKWKEEGIDSSKLETKLRKYKKKREALHNEYDF